VQEKWEEMLGVKEVLEEKPKKTAKKRTTKMLVMRRLKRRRKLLGKGTKRNYGEREQRKPIDVLEFTGDAGNR